MKIIDEYKEKYGKISKDFSERIDVLINKLSPNKKQELLPEIDRIMNIRWKSISFVIYLEPKATPRPRSGKNGIFYVKGAKDNKKIFKKWFEKQNLNMIMTPCKFICNSYFPIPSSMSPLEVILAELGLINPISRPDYDNVGKTYSDMIQDYLLFDDSLIIEGVLRKYYSTKPRIEITIKYMEDYDSKFNNKKIKKRER